MIIYKLTNKVNKKFYIGATTTSLNQRKRNHFSNPRYHIGNAIKKYGKKNFIIKQIDEAKTIEELDTLENYYIKKLKPHYNILSGGMKKFKLDDYTKQKISEYQMVAKLGNTYRLGKTHTNKTKNQISNSLKGNSNKLGKTGYKLSEETKKKMSASRMGDNNPAKRKEVREKLRLAALRRYGHKV